MNKVKDPPYQGRIDYIEQRPSKLKIVKRCYKKHYRESDMNAVCLHYRVLKVASYRAGADLQVKLAIKEKAYCTHDESRHRFRRKSSLTAI